MVSQMGELKWRTPFTVLMIGLALSGCGLLRPTSSATPLPPDYAALPDTVVCVVDRSTDTGLREIPAKIRDGGIVLFADGEVRPLESVHPVNVIAGYAGGEAWLTEGEPIGFQGRSFVRYLGERRIAPDLLRRAGEHRGVLIFIGADSSPPVEAIYIPTAPGCIFQGYVRDDLVSRSP